MSIRWRTGCLVVVGAVVAAFLPLTSVAAEERGSDAGPVVKRERSVKIAFADHHGTVIAVVNSSTQAVTKRALDPFGVPLASVAWPTGRGFLDKRTDVSTGTTHLGAREYHPGLGQFLSVDPIGDTTDPQQLNGYAYANNNPVTASDPTGLFTTAGDSGRESPSQYEAVDRFGHKYKAKRVDNGTGRVAAVRMADLLPAGNWTDFWGGIASSLTSTVDLIANAVTLRTPFSNRYRSYTTDWMVDRFDMSPRSQQWQRGETVSFLAAVLATGGRQARSPERPRPGKRPEPQIPLPWVGTWASVSFPTPSATATATTRGLRSGCPARRLPARPRRPRSRTWTSGSTSAGSTVRWVAAIGSSTLENPPGYSPSRFYDMELGQVRGYWNYFQDIQP